MNGVYSAGDINILLNRAADIYKEMKAAHPILTGGDDYALAILLTASNGSIFKLEPYYKALNIAGLVISNGLQMLSHIMVLHETNVEQKRKKMIWHISNP